MRTPFSWELQTFSSQGRVPSVVNLGGVVKILRRSNSLSRSVFSTARCFGHAPAPTFVGSPQMGLAPTGVWRVPPIPHCNWRTLPSSQTHSLPALSFPLPPSPLGSFCKAPGGGGPGWWGGGVPRRKGVKGGWPPSGTWGQTHIWGHSNLGVSDHL